MSGDISSMTTVSLFPTLQVVPGLELDDAVHCADGFCGPDDGGMLLREHPVDPEE